MVQRKLGLITADGSGTGLSVIQNFISQSQLDIDRFTTYAASGYTFSQAKQVDNIHIPGVSDQRPVLNASETIMYFGSNRSGGRGLDDVWTARRTSKQDEFGPGTHVRELSTAARQPTSG